MNNLKSLIKWEHRMSTLKLIRIASEVAAGIPKYLPNYGIKNISQAKRQLSFEIRSMDIIGDHRLGEHTETLDGKLFQGILENTGVQFEIYIESGEYTINEIDGDERKLVYQAEKLNPGKAAEAVIEYLGWEEKKEKRDTDASKMVKFLNKGFSSLSQAEMSRVINIMQSNFIKGNEPDYEKIDELCSKSGIKIESRYDLEKMSVYADRIWRVLKILSQLIESVRKEKDKEKKIRDLHSIESYKISFYNAYKRLPEDLRSGYPKEITELGIDPIQR